MVLLLSVFFNSCRNDKTESRSIDKSKESEFESNPKDAQIVTSDINLFWNAFDKLLKDTLSNPFQADYIDKASQGVIDFIPNKRIVSAEALKKLVLSEKEYYLNIRNSSFKSLDYEKQIRSTYYALKYLYPEAEFPPLYFIIGRTTSGATATENGLVVGIEVFSESKYETAYGRPSFDLDLLPFIVAHEIEGYLFSSGNLTENWSELDDFEGDEYERLLTKVKLGNSTTVEAFVYTIKRINNS